MVAKIDTFFWALSELVKNYRRFGDHLYLLHQGLMVYLTMLQLYSSE
jgi:hypothetical protein